MTAFYDTNYAYDYANNLMKFFTFYRVETEHCLGHNILWCQLFFNQRKNFQSNAYKLPNEAQNMLNLLDNAQ